MPANAVPGFLPSVHGFRFANRWPQSPARSWQLGLVQLGIGDTARGLCGGMAFAARDRFERGEAGAVEAEAPAPGTTLFEEIVERQLASFGWLWIGVPLRFWLAAVGGERRRLRETVLGAWPAIRAEIDAGRPAMLGLVRSDSWSPLAINLGHQVVAYRYDSSPDRIAIGIYDPNHPGDDTVEVRLERRGKQIELSQSTGESLLGLLALPYSPPRGAG